MRMYLGDFASLHTHEVGKFSSMAFLIISLFFFLSSSSLEGMFTHSAVIISGVLDTTLIMLGIGLCFA